MNKIVEIFKKLTAYDHFLVFLFILSLLKIVDVFIDDGKDAGLHFLKLGAALFVISTVLFFALKYGMDKQKKYLNALISTFLILLVLEHGDPDPVRALMVIVFLYVSKFLIKYKKKNIFNPVVFAVGISTLSALLIPAIGIPPLDWSGLAVALIISGFLMIEIPNASILGLMLGNVLYFLYKRSKLSISDKK